jgi:hypothetical protein
MTREEADFLEAMHKADVLMQPYALYCNPADAEKIKGQIPDSVKLIPLSFVAQGASYLVDRAKLEKDFLRPEVRE